MIEAVEEDIKEDRAFRLYMDRCHQRAKQRVRSNKRKRKRSGQYTNRDPQIAFLRQRICRLNYGTKVEYHGVRPELDTKKLIGRYNERRFGAALRNDQFTAHFEGNATHYFWADPGVRTPEILVMLDIDVHDGVGSPEGARRFADLVSRQLFPDLYWEPSTGGRGMHGYLVVKKEGEKVESVRQALNKLDSYLQELARAAQADISCVEVKGHPPVIRYDDYGNILGITFGQFAKLPRGRGVLDTCKVNLWDLFRLNPADIVTLTVIAPPVSTDCTREQPHVIKLRAGSFDTRIVAQDTLDQLPALEKYAAQRLVQWTGSPELKAGRWTVTAVDVAQFFAIMLSIKPDVNDSLPVRRIGQLWKAVYEAGDFIRPWNHHRFKAIRDLLSRHGHVDWVDFRYQNLPGRQGRACRWRLGYVLEAALCSLVKGEATPVDTSVDLPHGKHPFRTPKWHDFASEHEGRWWEEAERHLERLFAA